MARSATKLGGLGACPHSREASPTPESLPTLLNPSTADSRTERLNHPILSKFAGYESDFAKYFPVFGKKVPNTALTQIVGITPCVFGEPHICKIQVIF